MIRAAVTRAAPHLTLTRGGPAGGPVVSRGGFDVKRPPAASSWTHPPARGVTHAGASSLTGGAAGAEDRSPKVRGVRFVLGSFVHPPRARAFSVAARGARGSTAEASSEAMLPEARSDGEWISLGTSAKELRLDNTLPTGQSFRWRRTAEGWYVGVIGQRVVSIRQDDDDVSYRVHCGPGGDADDAAESAKADAEAVADYFNLEVSLEALSKGWAAADSRFAKLEPYLPGCRMLRQDPAECLFSFICSSNNHISRIHGMVERLCAAYGTRLEPDAQVGAMRKAVPERKTTPAKKPPGITGRDDTPVKGKGGAGDGAGEDSDIEGEPLGDFYAFPTVAQLGEATEEALREMGFGYRAKFITGAVAALAAKEEGPDAYLKRLREKTPYKEAQAALVELPGVGPKVAACVCLFSLDKHAAIPVDTHVWQLAVEHYTPGLEGKSLTPRVMDEVEGAIVGVFGDYAGWAHNTLFIAELAHVRAILPESLRTPPRPKVVKKEKTNSPASAAAAGAKESTGARKKGGVKFKAEESVKRRSAAKGEAGRGAAAGRKRGVAKEEEEKEKDGLLLSPQPKSASKRVRG